MSTIESWGTAKRPKGLWWLLLVVLGGTLAVVCHEAFGPNAVMWNNDSALGAIITASARLPDTYTGHWLDQWWLGSEVPTSAPTIATLLATVLSPVMFMKIFAPLTMLLLGFSAWLLFRRLKFAPVACVVGGLASGLNMHCFSNACWGLGTWNITIAMALLAMAALVTDTIRQSWAKAALAGLAVGLGVMDGFDTGAILSVFVAVFVVFWCWTTETTLARRISQTVLTGALVVGCSVFIAASIISSLISTQIQGIAGTGQSEQEKKDRWEFATMWSLPKLETLRLVMPGILGYRLNDYDTTTDKAGVYWGRLGEDPRIDRLESSDAKLRADTAAAMHVPDEYVAILSGDDADARAKVVDAVARATGMQRRHTGAGEYAGVLTGLLAIFALAQSCRRNHQVYSTQERRLVWFFGAAALFALVAAWGRYSFLYAWLYKLPYVSTIRNPIKFLHAFHLAWIVLAGFGLESLHRAYLQSREDRPEAIVGQKTKTAGWPGFEKGWMVGLALAAVAAGMVYWIYGATTNSASLGLQQKLATYIQHQGFDEEAAPRMAIFAIHEASWFILFFGLAAVTLVLILSGILRGRRAVWAWVILSAIMIFDLGRADRPWARYFDYKKTYALNPIIDFLRQKPYEHRVAAKLVANDQSYMLCPGEFGILGGLCHWWLENDFPYNDIESLDIDQMPRAPVPEAKILGTFEPRINRDLAQSDLSPPIRLWKLANVRYVLEPAAAVPLLNHGVETDDAPFHIRRLFNIVPKPGVTQPRDFGDYTAVLDEKGKFALIEIRDALPRAKLYANWQIAPNDETTLGVLNSDQFDPAQKVLVAKDTPTPQPPGDPLAEAGTVSITSYQPKDVQLQAAAAAPCVLLYNDRIADAWHAWVDQKPAPILRCNFIMRGVFLTPGDHTVEFRYQPPLGPLYVSLAAVVAGLALGGWLLYARLTEPPAMAPMPEPMATPVPAAAPTPPASAAPVKKKPRKK